MPPKSAKTTKVKQKPADEQREESLQAVVLADSFETRFKPFTLERPRCLLPLANTPLIEYTLEFLASGGVQEVYIYCGAHAEKVDEYLNASKWKSPSSPFHTLTTLKVTATSVGEAMRDLDRRDLVTGDFLVVSGDVVSNINLEPALARHRARREKDKNAIMTMVLREAGVQHRTKSWGRRPVFVIDPRAERCIHYEEMGSRKGEHRYISLDPDFLSSHGEIEVREDLIDCQIDICTPDVLAQWSENFDYQSLRSSFLYGVLKDYELNGKTIHTHIVKDQYAARVRSLRAYGAISKDVCERWTYPLCPDSNLVQGQNYHLSRGKVYQESGVILKRTSVVKGRTVIGADTIVGEGSVVSDSIVGRRCRIGKNVNLDRAYVWDDVTIEDGSTVRDSIIADNVVIGKSCTIDSRSLVSFGVVLSKETTLPGTTVTKGQDIDYFLRSADSDSDASSVASSHLVYRNALASTSNSSISTFSSDVDTEAIDTTRRDSFRSDPSDDTAHNRDFHLEATASILDGLSKGDSPDTIFLELNGYRMSVDASQHEVRQAVAAAFMKRISSLTESASMREAVRQVFTNYKGLVDRVILDKSSDVKVDQVDFLMLIQKEVVSRPSGDQLLLFVAKELYDIEIVEEDGILQWWEDARSKEGDMGKVRGLTEQLITFLQEAEEDDESEDEEESE